MSFQESGLPAHPLIEKAYNLANSIGGAVESAKILAEECPNIDPEILAGHLAAFNAGKMTHDQLEQEFSSRVAEIVEGVRNVYLTTDLNLKGKPHLSPDDGVRLSFLAVAILDLETAMEIYGQAPLNNILMSMPEPTEKGKVTIIQDSVKSLLGRACDQYVRQTLPIVKTTSEPLLERRFERALEAVKNKLAGTAPTFNLQIKKPKKDL